MAKKDVLPAHDYALLKPVTFKPLLLEGQADVLKIIDPQTILLHDGRTIHLSGLNFPDLTPNYAGEFSVLAKQILEDFLLGQTVEVYHTPRENWGRMNRMGHHLAHLKRTSDGVWVQGLLLSLGLAQARTTERTPEMAKAMYILEAKARNDKLGLWAGDTYAIRRSDIADQHIDSFQIVEGRIASAAVKSGRIYLNFGMDWRNDFTVSIASEFKKLFTQQQIDPLDWNRKFIRARGWVRNYNGPFMEITHPEAVEILD